jgi:nitrogen fixation protein FixH
MLTSSATQLSTSSPSAAELAQAERRARRFWVSLIVGLLGLQVLIGFGSIWLSLGDPTVAVVPNYHQKALDWDTTRRARQLTKSLGWQISPIVGVFDPENQKRLVRIAIRDRSGKVVNNLHVSGQVYHHARGANIHELLFTETDPGYYEATVSLAETGLWELQLQLEGEHGVASDVRDLIVE